jgi:hypothetical protein
MIYSRQNIQPPAAEAQIAALEQRFRICLPAELAGILRESNGVTLWQKPKEVQVLSTHEMTEYFECYGFPKWMPDAVPFAMDGNGNFLVLKSGVDQAVYVVSAGNLGWEDAAKISETMIGFLQDAKAPSDYLYVR